MSDPAKGEGEATEVPGNWTFSGARHVGRGVANLA